METEKWITDAVQYLEENEFESITISIVKLNFKKSVHIEFRKSEVK